MLIMILLLHLLVWIIVLVYRWKYFRWGCCSKMARICWLILLVWIIILRFLIVFLMTILDLRLCIFWSSLRIKMLGVLLRVELWLGERIRLVVRRNVPIWIGVTRRLPSKLRSWLNLRRFLLRVIVKDLTVIYILRKVGIFGPLLLSFCFVLCNQLLKRLLNCGKNFLFETIEGYEVFDENFEVVALSNHNVSSPIRSHNNWQISNNFRFFPLLFLHLTSLCIHL